MKTVLNKYDRKIAACVMFAVMLLLGLGCLWIGGWSPDNRSGTYGVLAAWWVFVSVAVVGAVFA